MISSKSQFDTIYPVWDRSGGIAYWACDGRAFNTRGEAERHQSEQFRKLQGASRRSTGPLNDAQAQHRGSPNSS